MCPASVSATGSGWGAPSCPAARSSGALPESPQGVKACAELTVPAGAEVFVTVIGPLPTPAGGPAFSFLADTAVSVPGVPAQATVAELVKPVPLIETDVPAP